MEEEEPTLEEILALGGTKEDIDLLKDNTKTTSDVSAVEISKFIESIGLIPGEVMIDEEAIDGEGSSEEGKEITTVTDKTKKPKGLKTTKEKTPRKKKDNEKKEDTSNESHTMENKKMKKEGKETATVTDKMTKKNKPKSVKTITKEKDNDKKEGVSNENHTKETKKRKRDKTDSTVEEKGLMKKEEKVKKRKESLAPKRGSEDKNNPNSLSKVTTDDITNESDDKLGVLETIAATKEAECALLAVSYTEHKKMLVPIDDHETAWFRKANSEPTDRVYSPQVVNHLKSIARRIMDTELKFYRRARHQTRDKDVQWLKTVLSSGTLNDKMAALTLLVQESPVHTLATVDQFVNMASKKGKRESILAIGTFKELVVSDLFPEDRKLKPLSQRPLHALIENGKFDHRLLLLWYYEDQLKHQYNRFVTTLQTLLHDPVAQIREKILGIVFDLLYQKPEQEQLLLQSVVNKMGDPNRRIASKCILLLLKLLTHHVNMKMIVVKEVEGLLYRHNLSEKAQYYVICFLNQVVINPQDKSLALKLVHIYFSFFKIYTSKSNFDAKIISALLTGVNRALPFLKDDVPSFEEHMNSLFKIVHLGPLATGIQSLVLLYQVMEGRQAVSARYYRALYQKLLDTRICLSTTQQAMFLNLLFKSVKNDPELNRVKAFLKRILQTCSYHSPHFICGCLVLISEVLKLAPSLSSFVLRSEAEDEEECFKDVVQDSDMETHSEREGSGEEEEGEKETDSVNAGKQVYIVNKIEPLYCRAETSCLWELTKLSGHYHPSVQVFSKKLLKGEDIGYSGDPLNDFTLLRFLDQFVHKNPKQSKGDKGGSLMQPTNNLVKAKPYMLPMSINELAGMEEEKVREDLKFIYQFMKRDKSLHQGKYLKKDKRKRDKVLEESDDSDEEDVGDDFAGELERSTKIKKEAKEKEERKKEKQRQQKKDSSDDDSDASNSEDEHSYSDMGESEFEDDLSTFSTNDSDTDDDVVEDTTQHKYKNKKKDDMNEAELEKLLLANMTSSSESEGEEGGEGEGKRKRKGSMTHETNDSKRHKRNKDNHTDSMFESAEKFAHLLKDDANLDSIKQTEWEDKRSFHSHRGRDMRRGRGDRRGSRGTTPSGRGYRGTSTGRGYRGTSPGGRGYRGTAPSGRGYRGTAPSGRGYRGTSPGGRGYRGTAPNGRGYRGTSPGGRGYRGTAPSGRGYRGTAPNGRGYRGTSPGGRGYRGTSGRGYRGTSPGGRGYRGSDHKGMGSTRRGMRTRGSTPRGGRGGFRGHRGRMGSSSGRRGGMRT